LLQPEILLVPIFISAFISLVNVGGTVYGDYIWADSPTKGSHYNYYVDICVQLKDFILLPTMTKTISSSGRQNHCVSDVAGAQH
jgi:hypothetical protein